MLKINIQLLHKGMHKDEWCVVCYFLKSRFTLSLHQSCHRSTSLRCVGEEGGTCHPFYNAKQRQALREDLTVQ